jgi:hypothetical protein
MVLASYMKGDAGALGTPRLRQRVSISQAAARVHSLPWWFGGGGQGRVRLIAC